LLDLAIDEDPRDAITERVAGILSPWL